MVFGADRPFAPSVGSFQVPVSPPDSDPDDGDQVTVCFSAAWLPFVLGSLQQLTLQATWKGDVDAIQLAQDRAQLLIAMFGGEVGGCFNTVCIKGLIYDPDTDSIKQTLDGGATFFDNPGADPRHNAPYQFPPVEADDPRCQAAANMVRYYSDLIDQVVLVVDEAGTAEGLLAIILPFVIELGPFGILIELVLGVAFILFSAGATAISAAFTSTVFDDLLCILFCNLESDGSCTADDLAEIKAQVDSIIGGLAAAVLDGMFFLQGEVGLSNAGTIGEAPADCDACNCGWCFEIDFTSTDGGWSEFTDGVPGANYTPGTGWTQKTSGGVTGTYIQSPTFDPTVFTMIEMTYDVEIVATSTVMYGQFEGGLAMADVCPAAGGTHVVTWLGSVTFDQVGLQVGNSNTGGGGTSNISHVRYFGDGVCPFGTPNCL
jgi:hypothetical protein